MWPLQIKGISHHGHLGDFPENPLSLKSGLRTERLKNQSPEMWTDLSMTPEPVCARPVVNDSGRRTVTPLNECLKPCVSYWLFLDSELGVTALSGCTVMWLLGVTTEQAGPLLRLHPNELQGPLSSVGTEVWRLVFLLSCHLSHG